MHFTDKFFIFKKTFDIFFSPQFSFFVCDRCNVGVSKVHNKSIIFLKFI